MIKITECPRDAMQGIKEFIPTDIKVKYLNLLLKVGFHRIDFGSFVSPKTIPQMRDTADLVDQLEITENSSSLLAIIANLRGAKEATQYGQISVLGFPFSVSETFQQRNTNRSINESLKEVELICNHCSKTNTQPLVYLSMGFGNNYGDEWSAEIVLDYAQQLVEIGVQELAIADTIGNSSPDKILSLYPMLKNALPGTPLGVHLHSTAESSAEKLLAAINAGCVQFDTAIRGFGGCPMAEEKLVGNIATESLINILEGRGSNPDLNIKALKQAQDYSIEVFGS